MKFFWWRKTTPSVEATEALESSREQLRSVSEREGVIRQTVSYLAERRELNHFGDDLSITFEPRRSRRHV